MEIYIRFYEELNDFLSHTRRKQQFSVSVRGSPSIKHLIESLGVPHTEVDLILVNGKSVPFSYIIQDKDRISAYPMFEAFDIATVLRLRPKPLRTPQFILDTHLGKLAKHLRMLGFSALYRNDYNDHEIVQLSLAEKRTILTRDRKLLIRKDVIRGYWVRNSDPPKQLQEVLTRFDLLNLINPFSLCIVCNGRLEKIGKEKLQKKISPEIYSRFEEFFVCSTCGKIYWKGTHYKAMTQFINTPMT